MLDADRRLPWDWYEGRVPENVVLDESSYLETSFSFFCYRSRRPVGVVLGRGSSSYIGTMFDVGREGKVTVGDYVSLVGVRIVCDSEIEIGDYSLLSWNVVLMDAYRMSFNSGERRPALEAVAMREPRIPVLVDAQGPPARPIRIGRNVWIGFDSCILPGVTIGDGSIVGARSVVTRDVEPYTVVAGNPARLIRRLEALDQ
ncbi:MAG TPA: acyltransferase [Blastocatellia bacterium]|nr:acyltransferase [Blastocatellia bacterium]